MLQGLKPPHPEPCQLLQGYLRAEQPSDATNSLFITVGRAWGSSSSAPGPASWRRICRGLSICPLKVLPQASFGVSVKELFGFIQTHPNRLQTDTHSSPPQASPQHSFGVPVLGVQCGVALLELPGHDGFGGAGWCWGSSKGIMSGLCKAGEDRGNLLNRGDNVGQKGRHVLSCSALVWAEQPLPGRNVLVPAGVQEAFSWSYFAGAGGRSCPGVL